MPVTKTSRWVKQGDVEQPASAGRTSKWVDTTRGLDVEQEAPSPPRTKVATATPAPEPPPDFSKAPDVGNMDKLRQALGWGANRPSYEPLPKVAPKTDLQRGQGESADWPIESPLPGFDPVDLSQIWRGVSRMDPEARAKKLAENYGIEVAPYEYQVRESSVPFRSGKPYDQSETRLRTLHGLAARRLNRKGLAGKWYKLDDPEFRTSNVVKDLGQMGAMSLGALVPGSGPVASAMSFLATVLGASAYEGGLEAREGPETIKGGDSPMDRVIDRASRGAEEGIKAELLGRGIGAPIAGVAGKLRRVIPTDIKAPRPPEFIDDLLRGRRGAGAGGPAEVVASRAGGVPPVQGPIPPSQPAPNVVRTGPEPVGHPAVSPPPPEIDETSEIYDRLMRDMSPEDAFAELQKAHPEPVPAPEPVQAPAPRGPLITPPPKEPAGLLDVPDVYHDVNQMGERAGRQAALEAQGSNSSLLERLRGPQGELGTKKVIAELPEGEPIEPFMTPEDTLNALRERKSLDDVYGAENKLFAKEGQPPLIQRLRALDDTMGTEKVINGRTPAETMAEIEAARAPKDVQVEVAASKAAKAGALEPVGEIPETGLAEPGRAYTIDPKRIELDPERFQFKHRTVPLEGEYDPHQFGIVTVWRQKDGRIFAVNGHHRVPFAISKNVERAPVLVLEEANGITAEKARAIGAMQNIGENSGDPIDFYNFFRSEYGPTEAEAKVKGLFRRRDTRDAFVLARDAGDSLDALYRSGELSLSDAARIAEATAGDEAFQTWAISKVLNDKKPAEGVASQIRFMRANGFKPEGAGPKYAQGEIPGTGVGSSVEAEVYEKIDDAVRARKKAISSDLITIKDLLSKTRNKSREGMGVSFQGLTPVQLRSKAAELESELVALDHYYTNPDLIAKYAAEAKVEAPKIKQGTLDLGPQPPAGPPAESPPPESPGQLDLFGGPPAEPPKPPVPTEPPPAPKAPPPEVKPSGTLPEATPPGGGGYYPEELPHFTSGHKIAIKGYGPVREIQAKDLRPKSEMLGITPEEFEKLRGEMKLGEDVDLLIVRRVKGSKKVGAYGQTEYAGEPGDADWVKFHVVAKEDLVRELEKKAEKIQALKGIDFKSKSRDELLQLFKENSKGLSFDPKQHKLTTQAYYVVTPGKTPHWYRSGENLILAFKKGNKIYAADPGIPGVSGGKTPPTATTPPAGAKAPPESTGVPPRSPPEPTKPPVPPAGAPESPKPTAEAPKPPPVEPQAPPEPEPPKTLRERLQPEPVKPPPEQNWGGTPQTVRLREEPIPEPVRAPAARLPEEPPAGIVTPADEILSENEILRRRLLNPELAGEIKGSAVEYPPLRAGAGVQPPERGPYLSRDLEEKAGGSWTQPPPSKGWSAPTKVGTGAKAVSPEPPKVDPFASVPRSPEEWETLARQYRKDAWKNPTGTSGSEGGSLRSRLARSFENRAARLENKIETSRRPGRGVSATGVADQAVKVAAASAINKAAKAAGLGPMFSWGIAKGITGAGESAQRLNLVQKIAQETSNLSRVARIKVYKRTADWLNSLAKNAAVRGMSMETAMRHQGAPEDVIQSFLNARKGQIPPALYGWALLQMTEQENAREEARR